MGYRPRRAGLEPAVRTPPRRRHAVVVASGKIKEAEGKRMTVPAIPSAGDPRKRLAADVFDHLVRSPEQFEYLRRYIADNPKAAGLASGEYLCWRREEEGR